VLPARQQQALPWFVETWLVVVVELEPEGRPVVVVRKLEEWHELEERHRPDLGSQSSQYDGA